MEKKYTLELSEVELVFIMTSVAHDATRDLLEFNREPTPEVAQAISAAAAVLRDLPPEWKKGHRGDGPNIVATTLTKMVAALKG